MSLQNDSNSSNTGDPRAGQNSGNNNNAGPNIKELLEQGNIWDDVAKDQTQNNNSNSNQNQNENTNLTQPKSVNDQIAEHLKPYNINITDEMAANPAAISEHINKSLQGVFTEAIRLMSSATKETVTNTKKEVTTELNQQRANEQFLSNLSTQVPLMNDPLLKPILTTLASKMVQRGVSEKDLPGHLQATLSRIGELVNEGSNSPRGRDNTNTSRNSGTFTPQTTTDWMKALTEDD